MKQNIQPNFAHLQAALYQYGPWEGQALTIDEDWLVHTLLEKVAAINWTEAAEDVARFLNAAEQESLKLWGERFFSKKVEDLRQAI